MRCSSFSKHWKLFILILTPIVALPILLIPSEDIDEDLSSRSARCAYVVCIMSVYWLMELLPIAVTALIPVVLFPLLGVQSTSAVTINYFKQVNMLMVGGLIVAIAIEECGLHRRIALKIMLTLGTKPRMLLYGFMVTTMFLSMWLSSIAVTVMMIPIATVVLEETDLRNVDPDGNYGKVSSRIRKMIFLSIAYSANIGGTSTMTGSTPNLALIGILEGLPKEMASGLNFSTWLLFGVPGMLVNIHLAWFWLQLVYMTSCSRKRDKMDRSSQIESVLRGKYNNLGRFSRREQIVTFCFVSMILLWFFRDPKFIPGWNTLIHWETPDGKSINIGNATPVVLIAILLFAFQTQNDEGRYQPILNWKIVQTKLPWGLILLLGGGFAMADASEKSCLSFWIGGKLGQLGGQLDHWLLVAVICLSVSFVTEITSNTATANIILPILIRLSSVLKLPPIFLALPAAITCSYAFMLPVATPPNAMVFEAMKGSMKTEEMFMMGFLMNLACVAVNTLSMVFYGPLIFDMNIESFENSTISSTSGSSKFAHCEL